MQTQVNEVNLEQAFNAVAAVCEAYKGTRQEHLILEVSLKAIKAKLDKSTVQKEAEVVENAEAKKA